MPCVKSNIGILSDFRGPVNGKRLLGNSAEKVMDNAPTFC
jgi:hypothetical protein